MKITLPFWAIIGIKIILSKIPINYSMFRKAGIFVHGKMDTEKYSISVFNHHLKKSHIFHCPSEKVIVEIGPGDSVATAIIAFSLGARAILVDNGRYATEDIKVYQKLTKYLKDNGYSAPDLSECGNVDQIIEVCQAKYLTNGIDSLKDIHTETIDFIFSQAVLEHISKNEFRNAMSECMRILKTGGCMSHRVDFTDHLGGGLNNLRFNDKFWESQFISQSGFYTNRISFSEMNSIMLNHNFIIDQAFQEYRDYSPIERKYISPNILNWTDDDLRTMACDFVAHKRD